MTIKNYQKRLFEDGISKVGGTPLLGLSNVAPRGMDFYGKMEMYEPSGSIKDRTALWMLERKASEFYVAGRDGLNGGSINEWTSGNTGIALATFASYFGYKFEASMSPLVGKAKQDRIKELGAKVLEIDDDYCPLNPGEGGLGYSAQLVDIHGYVPLNQYTNPANVVAHVITGREIWDEMNGDIDIFIAGIGTGGTISGVARYLKNKNPDILIVGVDVPRGTKSYGLKSLKDAEIYPLVRSDLIDMTVTIEDPLYGVLRGMEIDCKQGLAVGPTTGFNLEAVHRLSELGYSGNVAMINADGADRYEQEYEELAQQLEKEHIDLEGKLAILRTDMQKAA